MLLNAIWRGNVYAVLNELIRAGRDTYFSAGELANRLKMSKPTIIEGLAYLQAFGLVETIKVTENKEVYRIAELSPLLPLIVELIEVAQEYDAYITKNLFKHIDRILSGKYYIGMFWAAFQGIEPIDYHPEIFIIYTKKPKLILPLNFLESVYVATSKNWSPGVEKEKFIGVVPTTEFPADVFRQKFRNSIVSITSVERGIAQCFSKENIFYPPYAAALALVQNYEIDKIDEQKLVRVGREENSLKIIKAVAHYVEKRLGKGVFNKMIRNVKMLHEYKGDISISWGHKESKKTLFRIDEQTVVGIDTSVIENAIRTVFG